MLDAALIRALARAHRWKRLLEEGRYASTTEIAEVEKIGRSFVNRLLRLTLLAPDIQEAILEGRQAKGLQLEELTKAMPAEWGSSGGCSKLPLQPRRRDEPAREPLPLRSTSKSGSRSRRASRCVKPSAQQLAHGRLWGLPHPEQRWQETPWSQRPLRRQGGSSPSFAFMTGGMAFI